MVQSGRPGRKAGPLSGGTPEAEELAAWLRKLTEGLTVRDLAERFPFGRTQWSDFLRGRKIIPSWLVDDLVKELVKGPQKQQLQRQRGHELHTAAEAAEVTREAKGSSPVSSSEVELQIRLDLARQGQIEAQKTLLGTTQIVYMLLDMVSSLQNRCSILERERDQARAQVSPALPDIQHQLAKSQNKLSEAQKRLERARREREEAEELRVTAHRMAEEQKAALEKLQAKQQGPADQPDPETVGTTPTDGATSRLDELPELWEYDAALEVVDQQMDTHQADMNELREQMGIAAPDAEAGVVQGEVVRDNSADNPHKPTGEKLAAASEEIDVKGPPTPEDAVDQGVGTRGPEPHPGTEHGVEATSVRASPGNSFGAPIPVSSVLVSFGGTVPTTGLHGVQSLTPAVLVLNGTGKVLSEDYVLHPDHTETGDGSVTLLGDREEWPHDLPREQGRHLAIVKLTHMPATADRILFIASVSAGASRMGALPQRSRVHAEVFDAATMRQLTHVVPPGFTHGYAAVIADLRREPTGWSFLAGTQGGLSAAAIAKSYGARSYPHTMWF
jgi:stress response protein SCP2